MTEKQAIPTDSGQNLLNNFASHIRQTEISAIVEIGQPGVIQSEQMKNRRVKIVDTRAIFNRFVTDFIRFAVTRSTTNACARHPGHKTVRVVVASAASLGDGHSAELSAPDYKSAFQ